MLYSARALYAASRRNLSTLVYKQRIGDAIEDLHRGRIQADKDELLYLIKQCGHERNLALGRRLFDFIERGPYRSDRYVLNLLVDMYGKCGQIQEAKLLFNRVPHKNEFSWTLMVKAYAQNGYLLEAILYFRKCLLEGIDPSDYSCSIVIGACCSLGAVSDGRAVHTVVIDRGYESDVFVAAGLIHMYNKCGCLEDSRRAFDRLHHRDRFVYTAMIGGYVEFGHCLEAIRLFRNMDLDGVKADDITYVNVIGAYEILEDPAQCRLIHDCVLQDGFESSYLVQTALLNMYSNCGSVEDALSVFEEMVERDRVAWGSTIAACAHHGYGRQALYLFKKMELEGIKADIVLLSSLLDACATVEALAEGTMIHERIVSSGYIQDRVLKASILNMYSKCGNAGRAKRVFDEQLKSPPDAISWNVLIAACAKAGLDSQVVDTFRRMQLEGVMPTLVTFLVVLAACSHAGFLREGRLQFQGMAQDFQVEPNVECYCCIVDLLGRCGELEAGESLMQTMPYEPLEAGWTCLLSACGFHRDTDRASRIAKLAADMAPKQSSHYVLLSNMFTKEEEETNKLKEKLKAVNIFLT